MSSSTRSSNAAPRRASRAAWLLAVVALATAACRPSYPRCDKDESCAAHAEVCLNGQCQECREDAQCEGKYPGEHRACHDGRCDAGSTCASDADCGALACRGGHCVPECTRDADCSGGRHCAQQHCTLRCQGDAECGPQGHCVAGSCAAVGAGDAGAGAGGDGGCQVANGTITIAPLHFELNKYDVTPDLRITLERIVACLSEAPAGYQLVIEGHGDDRGTQEYNLALGEKRAQSVRAFMRGQGMDERALIVRSKGENDPLCTAETEACWAMNRRVQFIQAGRR